MDFQSDSEHELKFIPLKKIQSFEGRNTKNYDTSKILRRKRSRESSSKTTIMRLQLLVEKQQNEIEELKSALSMKDRDYDMLEQDFDSCLLEKEKDEKKYKNLKQYARILENHRQEYISPALLTPEVTNETKVKLLQSNLVLKKIMIHEIRNQNSELRDEVANLNSRLETLLTNNLKLENQHNFLNQKYTNVKNGFEYLYNVTNSLRDKFNVNPNENSVLKISRIPIQYDIISIKGT